MAFAVSYLFVFIILHSPASLSSEAEDEMHDDEGVADGGSEDEEADDNMEVRVEALPFRFETFDDVDLESASSLAV